MTLFGRILEHWRGAAANNLPVIEDEAWRLVLANHPFLQALNMPEQQKLAALCARLLAEVAVHGQGGVPLPEVIRVSIAAQACLPVLELGLDAYPRFSEIIVYPGDFVVQREIVDDAGVVHEYSESIAGEAWEGGPVVLSWDAAESTTSEGPAFNVVIHEFVHKLDMSNGQLDGVPRLSRRLHGDLDHARFAGTIDAAYDDFCARLDQVEAAIPHDVDPDSPAADRYYALLPLDAYAATDLAEFFSVGSECFFTEPRTLKAAYGELYLMLVQYYRQDPAARTSPTETTPRRTPASGRRLRT